MKSLVIYYSKTGNTKLMAETIAEEIKADILTIQPKREIKSSGFMLYMRGGFQSMTKKNVKLEEPTLDLNNYDLIILGTPVWAWRLNPIVRSFLKRNPISNKKIGLFCCCADKADGVIADLREILAENQILGDTQFVEPLKNDTEATKADAKKWVIELEKSAQ